MADNIEREIKQGYAAFADEPEVNTTQNSLNDDVVVENSTEYKLRECFDEMVVYKDLKKSNFFSSLSLPAFLRDWLLKKFSDDDGNFDAEEGAEFVIK